MPKNANVYADKVAVNNRNIRVLSHFVTMVQNCGTPYPLALSSLKFYITLRKILLNGAYRVNAGTYNTQEIPCGIRVAGNP